MTNHRMQPEEFVNLATTILENKGVPHTTFGSLGNPSKRYEDDTVVIVSHFNGLRLQIERKAQPTSEESHLRVSNPVTMVDRDGQIIRHHGEHEYIRDYLLTLASDLKDASDG